MKKINSIILAVAFVVTLAFVSNASAQETMMKKVGGTVSRTAKKTYSRGKRVGHTIGNKTWNGSKWVASNSYRGGKWVAVKGVNGTKWVYRKGKRVVTGTKRRIQ